MPPFLGHVVCLFFQQIKSTLHVDTTVASAEWPEMHTLLHFKRIQRFQQLDHFFISYFKFLKKLTRDQLAKQILCYLILLLYKGVNQKYP